MKTSKMNRQEAMRSNGKNIVLNYANTAAFLRGDLNDLRQTMKANISAFFSDRARASYAGEDC
jgi:hypothetical protein